MEETTRREKREEEELAAYLRRVGFFPRQQQQKEEQLDGHESPALTAATLVELHQRQVRQVPFENLDQHSARHIVLDLDVIYDKVVQRQRGGFCFELNGLYAEMLRRLGFDVVLYPARVQSEGSWTTLKSHVVTVVRVKEPKAKKQDYPPDDDDDGDGCELQTWISDVGYASCPHTPLRYDWIGVEQPGDGEWAGFRLTRVKAEVAEDNPDQECVMMERRRKADGEWLKAILIYEQPRSLAELTPDCDALQADEETHLSKRILISAISESGRKTMSGAYRLITTTFADGQRVERNIMTGDGDGERVAREAATGDGTTAEEGQRQQRKSTEKEVYLEVLQREFDLRLTEDEQRALDLEKSKRNSSVW